jgi:hypothetical protein
MAALSCTNQLIQDAEEHLTSHIRPNRQRAPWALLSHSKDMEQPLIRYSDAPRGREGWPAPGGGAGLREADGRYLRVARRSIAVMSLAGGPLPGWLGT